MTTMKASKCLRLLLGLSLVVGAVSCGGDPAENSAIEQPVAATYTFSCPVGFVNPAVLAPVKGFLPFVPLTSLTTIANPAFGVDLKTGARIVRGDLTPYVADLTSIIQLGKAFFWDIQAGSDNKVSCATCHFQAGQDVRTRNQINPAANGSFDSMSANYTLTAADFPFTDMTVGKNVDNVSGSQGVRASAFVGIDPTTGVESTTPLTDPVFGTVRQSTGLNTPSVINAVFNLRNFFNGRAQAEFNGVNPFGNRDFQAFVRFADSAGNIGQLVISIGNASLASQAVGPPLNSVEMSAAGRTFPDLGRKLMALKPLGLQTVNPKDSVLGALDDTKGKGLKTTYKALIQKAFQPTWWNSTQTVTINNKPYSLMEANFSLFWGLAVMHYMASLVADNTPMDQYVATRTFDIANGTGALLSDDPTLLDQVVTRLAAQGVTIPTATGPRAVTRHDILLGIDLFEKPLPPIGTPLDAVTTPGWISNGVGCAFCHLSAEMTSASIRNLTVGVDLDAINLKDAGFDLRMERMFMGVRPNPLPPPQPPPPVPLGSDVVTFDSGSYAVNVIDINGQPVTPQPQKINTYDVGFYNLGVRPTSDNLGVGGLDPFGFPLSFTEFFQTTRTDPSTIKVPGGGLVCIDPATGLPVTPPAAPLSSVFRGEVLNPATGFPLLSGGLLKAEATDVAGSFKTPQLRNVELNGPYFHTGGYSTLAQVIDFYDNGGNFANPSQSPLMRPLALTADQQAALISFLLALTDDRVMYQRAPFDHPELPVPAGQDTSGADLVTVLPAVGAGGSTAPVPRYLGLNPFSP
jgi:cytochrome c peroxidase